MQVILRQIGDSIIRRVDASDLISIMEIKMKTLPEHYSDYFYESLLAELPEAFLRRCFFHYIKFPDFDTLTKIVNVHFPDIKKNLLDSANPWSTTI